MKLVKNKFWINKECPTVKKNQHIYKMFLKRTFLGHNYYIYLFL